MSKKRLFDVKEHLRYRKLRQTKANISNERLLGLSTVEINPTELCNRRCSFCPRSDPSVYPNRSLHMTIETATALRDSLIEFQFDGDIHITGYGEPTLNPIILSIIKVFSPYFFTEMISNGDNFQSGRISMAELNESGLDSLIVDCYDNEEQTIKIEGILRKFNKQTRIRNHYDDGSSDLFQLYNYNNRGGLKGDCETLSRPCFMPTYKSFIDWNGDVGLCCNDWSRSQKAFGNVNEDSFSKIWMSVEFAELRRNLLKGNRKDLPACKNCNTNGCKSGDESAEIWNKYLGLNHK